MLSSSGIQNQSNGGGSLEPTAATAASTLNGKVSNSTAATDPNKVVVAKQQQQAATTEIVQTMSTSALEAKLRQLRQSSQDHSQILTQKLASSQSGQNLLHIGTSLSTLPPDLHNLLTQLHPVQSIVDNVERNHIIALQALIQQATAVRTAGRRVQTAADAADLYADFCSAEKSVQRETGRGSSNSNSRRSGVGYFGGKHNNNNINNRRPFSHQRQQQQHDNDESSRGGDDDDDDNINEDGDILDELHHAASLERAAHITLCLVDDLNAASQHVSLLTTTTTKRTDSGVGGGGGLESSVTTLLPSLKTPLEHDTEKAQFLMKLAPRIRRLESDTIRGLSQRMEIILQDIQERRRQKQQEQEDRSDGPAVAAAVDITTSNSTDSNGMQSQASAASTTSGNALSTAAAATTLDGKRTSSDNDLLLMLGHCMRGLALLGRGKEVESIFARVAIMPLIRSKLSMGRLDEGGARGECAGLSSLLQEMISTIQETFGSVLCLAEAMFNVTGDTNNNNSNDNNSSNRITMDVDLLTAGVWVPIATALMADAAIKMAIFSPGIASILQANYITLDVFLSELAEQLLREDSSVSVTTTEEDEEDYHLFYRPTISMERIQQAQDRIYTHAKTAEFSKRWNLPIYYQLRFGECCTRLNKAVDQTKREGWIAQVFSGSEQQADNIKQQMGFELSLFLELYDILLGLWRPDVILRPLTNRFLRGAVQMIGRVVAFISDSMEGKIKFGEEPPPPPRQPTENGGGGESSSSSAAGVVAPPFPSSSRRSYCWGESEEDVAAVAWELTILESAIQHDYVDTVCKALAARGSSRHGTSNNDGTEQQTSTDDTELRQLMTEVLQESSEKIHPIIDKAWNEIIVQILTAKCSSPLAAVKGVAATYRMTNRPPPTQASPFVATILRPLREFSQEYLHRTPDRIGSQWKQQIVVTISDRYAAAVQELLTTVQRTEEALKNRKTTTQRARLTGGAAAAGMSDGEKVKLQVYLDFVTFHQSVRDVGIDPGTVLGVAKLQELTAEGESLQERLQENAK